MELTTNDKQRIMNECKKILNMQYDPLDAMAEAAEYATIFEREQQAMPSSHKGSYVGSIEYFRKYAVTVLELTKGFTPEQRQVASNAFNSMEELAGFVLELTSGLEAERSELLKENEQLKKLLDNCTHNSRT